MYFFCFQSHNHVYYQSTYYQSKYFWNVEIGIEQFRYACSLVSKVKGHLWPFWKFFFLDFSNSVPAQKILITTRFFCLIMLHLIVNCKNHHSEVCHLSKKIIKWVFLSTMEQLKIDFESCDRCYSQPSPFLMAISGILRFISATSMLVTDVGGEMCWRQLLHVGDGFGRVRHQHALSFDISVQHQHPKYFMNI